MSKIDEEADEIAAADSAISAEQFNDHGHCQKCYAVDPDWYRGKQDQCTQCDADDRQREDNEAYFAEQRRLKKERR